MRTINLVRPLGAAALLLSVGCGEDEIDIITGDDVFICHCEHPETFADKDVKVCAEGSNVVDTCRSACFTEHAYVYVDNSPTGDKCPEGSGTEGYVLGDQQEGSGEASIDGGSSEIAIYNGEQVMGASGEVLFTGGCESSTCAIRLGMIDLIVDDFSVLYGGDIVELSDVHITSLAAMDGTQTGTGFVIPSDQVRLILNASVNGDHMAAVFASTDQDLVGYYVPSTDSFGLSGEFNVGADSLELDLQGEVTSPPQ